MSGAPHGDGQRRAPGAAAEHGDPALAVQLQVMPWPRAGRSRPAAAPPRRAASASVARNASRRRRSCRSRKRSRPAQAIIAALSVHSAIGGATKAKPCRAQSASSVRADFGVGGDAAGHHQRRLCHVGEFAAEAGEAAADAVVQRVGDRRLEGGADVGDVLVAQRRDRGRRLPHRRLQPGEGEIRAAPRPSAAAGNRSACGSPFCAAFSTFGPPG